MLPTSLKLETLGLFLGIGGFWCALACSTTFAQQVDFERDIFPIFEENCSECHGADVADEPEGDFLLDRRVSLLKGGGSGEAGILPGDPLKGSLMRAIGYEDGSLEMPPEGKMDDESIDLIKRWIEQGAVWPGQMDDKIVREKSDHWAFQPVVRPNVPKPPPRHATPVRNEIDAFIAAKLTENNISASPEADPQTLIQRAAIVLTGLPPLPEQVDAFVQAYDNDSDTAYTELVDRLLASPHFGERWAQHWLDVIRWAETNGSESNMYRKNAWVYRDYVIGAFNQDKPYDQFIHEQIAGDTLGTGEATGFLVAGPHVPAATVGREPSAQRQARADRMDEVMQTVGASMMGMTIGCARCHNHKFDPIGIRDYYSMTAAFQDVEFGTRYPEHKEDHPRQRLAQEIHPQLEQQRDLLRKSGPWVESVTGFDELHFHAQTTTAVRIEFFNPKIRIDELEFFGRQQGDRNLIHQRTGVTVQQNEKVKEVKLLQMINDGKFGKLAWICKADKKGSERGWLEFTFKEPQTVDRMRISTNREDVLGTDYLKGVTPKSFGDYIVKVKSEDGQWQQVAHTRNIKQKYKDMPARAEAIGRLRELLARLGQHGPRLGFFARFVEPVDTYVLLRGSPENHGDQVGPAGLEELDGKLDIQPDAAGPDRRAAFAAWLAQKEHPLTSRVMVNRLWHHVFGQGIVATTSDFGKAGMLPTHPELLDWLASEFVKPMADNSPQPTKPWSMKHMIRIMVMSHAFRQQSLPREDCLNVDAGATLLWRFPPKRMEAEVIRDSIIQASGSLDDSIGGRSYRIHNVKKRYAQWEVVDNHSEKTWRRLIYQERMRRVDDQNFTAFDFPDCGQIKARRPVSTTPLQALNLMNSDFVVEQSKLIAARAQKEAGDDASRAIVRCFELLLKRVPVEEELGPCLTVAKEEGLDIVCRALINSNEFAFLP